MRFILLGILIASVASGLVAIGSASPPMAMVAALFVIFTMSGFLLNYRVVIAGLKKTNQDLTSRNLRYEYTDQGLEVFLEDTTLGTVPYPKVTFREVQDGLILNYKIGQQYHQIGMINFTQVLRFAPATGAKKNHWHILGCIPTQSRAQVERAFRRMSMVYHPDQGGNTDAFLLLQRARDFALDQCTTE